MAAPELPAEKAAAPKRPLIMRFAARSDVGRVRAKNDDSGYAGRHLAVVADGMGGHAGGDVASAATVLDMIHLDHDHYAGDASTVLADEIQTANSLLSELVHVNPKLAGMGTTVTALLLAENKLHFAHIGDSRAYRLRNGVFEQVSVDHTFVQRLIDEGRLRPEEAETHPHKNVLMRVLGDVDASPELDLDILDVQAGERWLLCSDGLNYVAGHVVERTVRETKDLRECAEHLVDLTLEAGSPDNVTVVVVDIAEETSDDVRTDSISVIPAPASAGAMASAGGQAAGGSPAGSGGDASAGSPAGTGTGKEEKGDAATDPHLGEHLSAEVLRDELSSRPHVLVGAGLTAAESGSIPTIAGRTMARRAATVLTHKSSQTRDDALEYRPAARPRRWITASIAAAIVALLAAGLWLGYAWTQTRYYIGEHDQHVAIFNGVSQRLGPFQLSTLEAVTEIRMSDLPEFSQQRVRQTVPARDLYDAQRIVKNLEQTGTTTSAEECVSPAPAATAGGTATPGQSPAAGATPAPDPISGSPSASPSATGSASPTAGGTARPSRAPVAASPYCEGDK